MKTTLGKHFEQAVGQIAVGLVDLVNEYHMASRLRRLGHFLVERYQAFFGAM